MSPNVDQRQSVALLRSLMRNRGLEFTDRSDSKLPRYASEKIIALAQILVMEGKANFVTECEISGLTVRGSDDL